MFYFSSNDQGSFRQLEQVNPNPGLWDVMGTRLALTLTVVQLCVFAALIGYFALSTLDAAERVVKRDMEPLARALVMETRLYLAEMHASTDTMSLGSLFIEAGQGKINPRLAVRLRKQVEGDARLHRVDIFDAQGTPMIAVQAGMQEQPTLAKPEIGGAVEQVLAGNVRGVGKAVRFAENLPVFHVAAGMHDPEGKLVGVVQSTFLISDVGSTIYAPVKFGKTGRAFLLNAEGKLLAHTDTKEPIGKTPPETATVAQAMSLKDGHIEGEVDGKRYKYTLASLPEYGWVVGIAMTEDELLEDAYHMATVIAVVGAGMAVLLAFMTFVLLNRKLTVPTRALRDFSLAVAKGDYTAWANSEFVCELKDLAVAMRHMRYRMRDDLGFTLGALNAIGTPCGIVGADERMLWCNQALCTMLRKPGKPESYQGAIAGAFYYGDSSRETMSQKAIKANKVMEGRVQAPTTDGRLLDVAVYTAPFYDLEGKLLGALSFWSDITDLTHSQQLVEEQRDNMARSAKDATVMADALNAATRDLSSQIGSSRNDADVQRKRVDNVAAATDAMNVSIQQVAHNATEAAHHAESASQLSQTGTEEVKAAVAVINTLRGRIEAMHASLTELGTQADGIGTIIDMISDIADQTNLLALNAAIEAARAGDAGRGFAVVADEVRKLAEKTMSATVDVGKAIRSIQGVTHTSVQLMEQASTDAVSSVEQTARVGASLEKILEGSTQTAHMVRGIAAEAQQQSQASQNMAQATDEINSIASRTADAMTQSADSVDKVHELAEDMRRLIVQLAK